MAVTLFRLPAILCLLCSKGHSKPCYVRSKCNEVYRTHQTEEPADQRIRFRIGVEIGDVIADRTDFHGDGVNIAARLQAACPPGDICVSRTVYDHVHVRLGLNFRPLGILSLKNILRPVEAFIIELGSSTKPALASNDRDKPDRIIAQVAGVLDDSTNIGEQSQQPAEPSVRWKFC